MAELDGAGVFTAMVSSGANLTEKAMDVPLGVARTIRDELFRATYAGVDWVEGIHQSSLKAVSGGVEWVVGVNQSSFKVVREMLQRMDKLFQGAVEGLDSVAAAVTRVVRGSGETASDLVAQTADATSQMISRTAVTLTAATRHSPAAMASPVATEPSPGPAAS